MDSEKNKALVRQHVAEYDEKWTTVDFLDQLDFLDKWFTDDFKLHLNSATVDLAGYKEMLPAFHSTFADLRHEILFMLAQDDLVTYVSTVHMKHIGEWEGIAPTGRTVQMADIAVVRLQEGKLAEEWVVVDIAGLRPQLEGPLQGAE